MTISFNAGQKCPDRRLVINAPDCKPCANKNAVAACESQPPRQRFSSTLKLRGAQLAARPLERRVSCLSWNLNFDIASFRGAVNCPNNRTYRALDAGPACRGQGHDCDTSGVKVLLILQVQIGRDENPESFLLGDVKQLAVR